MTDPFDIPERELPDSIRTAARERIRRGLRSGPPRRGRRAPLAIAAAVVVFIVGALALSQVVRFGGGAIPAASPEPIPNGCSPDNLDAMFEQTGNTPGEFEGAVVLFPSHKGVRCAFDGDYRHYKFTMVGNYADHFETMVVPSPTAVTPKLLTVTDGATIRLGISWQLAKDGDDSSLIAEPTGLLITLPGGGTITAPWKLGQNYAGGVYQRKLTVDGFQSGVPQ
jgi:hypothetical protein